MSLQPRSRHSLPFTLPVVDPMLMLLLLLLEVPGRKKVLSIRYVANTGERRTTKINETRLPQLPGNGSLIGAERIFYLYLGGCAIQT